MIQNGQNRIQQAPQKKQGIQQAAVTAEGDPEAPMKLAVIRNEIQQGDLDLNMDIPIIRTETEKTAYSKKWRTY